MTMAPDPASAALRLPVAGPRDLDVLFTQLAARTARLAGRPSAFLLCCLVVVVWALTGPLFGFADAWQLVINTGTTVVTFLMVFLIQNEQNRDTAAIHAKLDELIRSSTAENAYIGIEHLTDRQLCALLAALERWGSEAGDAALPRPEAS
jgi:low affinity Fe/Cu permease